MSVESALAQELMNSSSVGAVMGDRIYPMAAPQSFNKPYVVYERLSSDLDYTQNGISNLQLASFRLTIGGGKYADVVNAHSVLQSALSGELTGDGSVNLIKCWFDAPDDNFVLEPEIFVRTVQVDVQYSI